MSLTTHRIEREDPQIAELLLTGPGRGNAMGPEFWTEFRDSVEQLSADPALRCLIVRGAGENFCYGLDLAATGQQLGLLLGEAAQGRNRIVGEAKKMQAAFNALADSRLPVIVAVHGWCIGAGVELCAAADFRLASSDARFALREVKVGIVPDLGGIQRLPYLIGEGWARQMALTGDELDAATAARIGLVTEVYADPQALLDGARALAKRICANPPMVVSAIKRVMADRMDAAVSAGNHAAAVQNGMLMQSEDFAEAMRAFMERREPKFQGR